MTESNRKRISASRYRNKRGVKAEITIMAAAAAENTAQ